MFEKLNPNFRYQFQVSESDDGYIQKIHEDVNKRGAEIIAQSSDRLEFTIFTKELAGSGAFGWGINSIGKIRVIVNKNKNGCHDIVIQQITVYSFYLCGSVVLFGLIFLSKQDQKIILLIKFMAAYYLLGLFYTYMPITKEYTRIKKYFSDARF